MTIKKLLLAALLAAFPPSAVHAQSPALSAKARFTKRDVMIPMRDGVKLFTSIYTPKDQSQRYPILLTRTGYGIPPYRDDQFPHWVGPSSGDAKEGYIVVYQDVRGRFKSEGEFIHHRPIEKGTGKSDESTD